MFAGEHINVTEDRAVLHVALRAPRELSSSTRDSSEVHEVLDRMAAFSRARAQRRLDRPHRQADPNVVNIGIGGSDLGPVMAYEALRHYSRPDMTFRFVSNVDAHRLRRGDARPRPRGDAVRRLLEDVHDARDDDERAAPASGCSRRSATRPRSRSTSSPSRRTRRRCRSSASTRTTCSASGTGSAAATRWTRRSACRR